MAACPHGDGMGPLQQQRQQEMAVAAVTQGAEVCVCASVCASGVSASAAGVSRPIPLVPGLICLLPGTPDQQRLVDAWRRWRACSVAAVGTAQAHSPRRDSSPRITSLQLASGAGASGCLGVAWHHRQPHWR
jgi:hypothetical protein